jgi:RNA polymerase sigma-70 factor, ECF subfamily
MTYVARAAEQAFRRYYGPIFRYVRSRSGSPEEAEDIAQTVFVEAVARLGAAERGATPELAWLYLVARRRLIDAARRRDRSLPTVPLELVAEVANREPTYGPELAEALKRALASLPQTQRQVVVLRLLEGRSFSEIAKRTGATEAAAKMRFSRSLAAIRERLEQEGVTP